MNISLEDQRLWAKVAKLYYEDDLTQGEIAERLGFSRVKVHRILQSAREAGIIQIHITAPDSAAVDLENQLIRKYDLRDSLVTGSFSSQGDSYLALARGAAGWLKNRLVPGIRVGLGLGRTLSFLPAGFQLESPVACTFTEVAGAISDHSWGFESNNVASQMAELAGGKAELFYAPTLVSSPALKAELIKERSVKKSLERARSCDIVLQSVGPVDETALLYIQGYVSREQLADLKAAGAAGDALGCYYDRQGKIIPSPTEELMIGLHLNELVDIPWSVLIGGGPEKVVPIDSALIGNYFNVLITDSSTAESLLGLP